VVVIAGLLDLQLHAHYPDWESLFLLLNAACSREATNTNVKVFGLIRTELESTIYRTRSKHANHYTPMLKDWLVRKQDNVSQWNDTSTHRQLFQ
jgi:hypothetical protein